MDRVIGIIPAAGKGTRLGLPFPKEITPVTFIADTIIVIIETNIQQLANAGIKEAIIVISPDKQIIKDYLGDNRFGVSLRYIYQNRKYSKEGLTDAVMSTKILAKEYDLCVMLMADVYFTDPDTVKDLVSKSNSYNIATLSIWKTQEPHRFGIVELGDQNRVIKVIDKPEGLEEGYHWGAVAFRPDFWFYMDYEKETFSHALNQAVDENVNYIIAKGKYLDIGNPRSLIEGVIEINK